MQQAAPQEMPAQDQPQADTSSYSRDVKSFISEVNIAEHLDEKELASIGQTCYDDYFADLESRKHWEKALDEWTKMALQVREDKIWPWPRASNVKYPLLSTAAMQFSARAYPALIPSNGDVVKAKVIGFDPNGEKAKRAERVSKHMSYQIMEQMDDWEDDMDRLLIILPIVGTCFKKTYWNSQKKQNCSKLVLPKDLIINYWSKSMEDSERKTERILMPQRILKERQLQGVFLDIDLPKPTHTANMELDKDKTKMTENIKDDDATPYLILEQHRFLDLDGDGYPEPYIVTFDEDSRTVLRITARFDDDGVVTDEKGRVISIEPTEYYTKYGFIPNPDGGFYDLGFGLLLGTLNESVNTIINQLIDGGTLSNLQSGFIGKGLRIKMGESRFTPGEWKAVNATGDDLRKQIVPLPVREPSDVLFKLLGTLVESAKELASVAEIFVGKMPGQNTPATTTMATIEQGMKVFTAIYKRIYRSLTKEFKKLYRLNRIYHDPNEETQILDAPSQNDYDDKSYDICPAADPAAVSSSEKVTKFQAVMQLMQLGTLDPAAVTKRGLEALEIPHPEELMRQGPPPPSPEQMKAQADQQAAAQKAQLAQQDAQLKAQMLAQKQQMEQAHGQAKLAMEAQYKALELQYEKARMELELQKKSVDVQASGVQHAQKIRQSDEQHQQKLRQKGPNDQK